MFFFFFKYTNNIFINNAQPHSHYFAVVVPHGQGVTLEIKFAWQKLSVEKTGMWCGLEYSKWMTTKQCIFPHLKKYFYSLPAPVYLPSLAMGDWYRRYHQYPYSYSWQSWVCDVLWFDELAYIPVCQHIARQVSHLSMPGHPLACKTGQ